MSNRYLATMLIAMLAMICASQAATLSGRVLNATENGAPVVNHEVTLLTGVMSETEPARSTVRSNVEGEFAFRNVDVSPGRLYQLVTEFDGHPQSSRPFHISDGTNTHNLLVYNTITSADNITIEKSHILIAAEEPGVAVTAVYIFRNTEGIYIGEPQEGTSQRLGLELHVPENGYDFQILHGRLAAHHEVAPWGFYTTVPFHPGTDTLVYAYRIPWEGNSARWDVMSPYRIASLSVIAMAGTVEIEVEGGSRRRSEMGPQVVNIEREMVPPGEAVSISAVQSGTATSYAGRWLLVLAVTSVTVLVLIALYVRNKQRTTGTGTSVSGSTQTDEPVSASQRSDQDHEASEDNVADTLVQEIATLDDLYESGEIAEAEYVERRRQLKRDLVHALKNEDV